MNLLDDARRLLQNPPGPGDNSNWCHFCFEDRDDHEPDCPWLAVPRIVAALEAAERLIESKPAPSERHMMGSYAAYMALVAALQDEGA